MHVFARVHEPALFRLQMTARLPVHGDAELRSGRGCCDFASEREEADAGR
jgi:hypothetical protein